jgi:hypothetical protein
MKCSYALPFGWEGGPPCPRRQVATDGVHDDHNGLCTTVSWVLTLPDLTPSLVAVAYLVVGYTRSRLSQIQELQVWNPALDVGTSCVSTWFWGPIALKGAELKATCSWYGSYKPTLEFNLKVGQWWVLICSPLQVYAANTKAMVTRFALVVPI